jgi:hypothetical protein
MPQAINSVILLMIITIILILLVMEKSLNAVMHILAGYWIAAATSSSLALSFKSDFSAAV